MQTLNLNDTELIQDFQKTKNNDTFNQILKMHDKLLKKLRHKFFNLLDMGVSLDELEQEILIGFYGAILKYNPDRGMKFSTYCYTYVSHNLCDLYGKQRNLYKNIADNNIAIFDTDDGDTALDLLSSIASPTTTHDCYLENDYYSQIRDYISKLDAVSQTICLDYLCNGLTQREIAEQHNISAMYVSRSINKITEQLHQIIAN